MLLASSCGPGVIGEPCHFRRRADRGYPWFLKVDDAMWIQTLFTTLDISQIYGLNDKGLTPRACHLFVNEKQHKNMDTNFDCLTAAYSRRNTSCTCAARCNEVKVHGIGRHFKPSLSNILTKRCTIWSVDVGDTISQLFYFPETMLCNEYCGK